MSSNAPPPPPWCVAVIASVVVVVVVVEGVVRALDDEADADKGPIVAPPLVEGAGEGGHDV